MTIAEALTQAFAHHRAGRLAQAEQLYREILQADPRHVDALRWPECAEAHNNLAVILQAQGRLEEAAAGFRQAIRIKPDSADAHWNLAATLKGLGKLEEAVGCYRDAIRYMPEFAEGHFSLGTLLNALNRPEEAEACQREAIRLKPDYAQTHNNLGVALQAQGRLHEAAASYRAAIRLDPDFAAAFNNLGNVLRELGEPAEAADCCRESLRRMPDSAEAHANLGNALTDQDKLPEAVASYREAVRLKPEYAEAHNNLGNALWRQGELLEAAAYLREAIRLQPDFASAHANLGLVYLQLGNYEQGWREYEWRWRTGLLDTPPAQVMSRPLWDGTPLGGKTILLHAEGGFGDMLQFIRYAAVVRQRGGRVLLVCREELIRLLSGCQDIEQVVRPGDPLPPFDVRAPLLSLPHLLSTTERIPADIPYIDADPGLVQSWRTRLEPVRGFRVGVVWQGNPWRRNIALKVAMRSSADGRRSFPLASFEALARLPGVRLVSLQKGFGAEQISEVADRFAVADLGGMLNDFSDTAAVVKNLDLVISADSAPAHLAGALGVPVWVPLPFVSCWRWTLEGEHSPWYPSMRLFRQQESGTWDEVFERMERELAKLVAPHT